MSTGTSGRPSMVSPDGAVSRDRKRARRLPRALVVAIAIVGAAMILAAVAIASGAAALPGTPAPAAPVATATSAPRLTAHGEVRPVHQAHVASLTGGVVKSVAVQ